MRKTSLVILLFVTSGALLGFSESAKAHPNNGWISYWTHEPATNDWYFKASDPDGAWKIRLYEWTGSAWSLEFQWVEIDPVYPPDEMYPTIKDFHIRAHAFVLVDMQNDPFENIDSTWYVPAGNPQGIVKYNGTIGTVGGIAIQVDRLALLAPYIGLASTITVGAVATAVYAKRVKHREEKQ